MNDPLRIELPAGSVAPVVYDSPHSGGLHPPDFKPALAMVRLRLAENAHVEALFAHVARDGAPLLHAAFPVVRLSGCIDLDDSNDASLAGRTRWSFFRYQRRPQLPARS